MKQRARPPTLLFVSLLVLWAPSHSFADRTSVFTECMSKVSDLPIYLPASRDFIDIVSKSIRTDKKSPAIVVRPNTEQDVQHVVKCARKAEFPVCPRSGGHDLEGQSLCGGVMVDLIHLQKVELSKATKVVKLGPAAMLGQAVAEMYAQSDANDKRCMAVGVCPGVGIAGFLLGGGHGPYSGKLGLTCDSLVSIRMVTERGQIVTANKRQNTELFRASCGGSGGIFGIVTEFRVKTASCKLFDEAVIFRYQWDISVAGEVIKKWFDYDHNNGSTWLRLEVNRGDGLVGYGMCWGTKSKSECESRFRGNAFWDVGTRTTLLLEPTRNVLDTQAFLGPNGDWARRRAQNPVKALTDNRYHEAGDANGRLYQSTMLKVDGAAGAPSAKFWQTYARWCDDGISTEAWSVCQWNPFVNEVKKDKDNYFPHRSANTITEYITAPLSDSDREFGRARMHNHLKKYIVGVYSNYPEPAEELPGSYPRLYWGQHLRKLKALKREYNPCNFFAKEQTVPGSTKTCATTFVE